VTARAACDDERRSEAHGHVEPDVDPELVQRAQRGDRDAFGAIANELAERMRRVAFGIVRDADQTAFRTS
jgi:hypothetical protein